MVMTLVCPMKGPVLPMPHSDGLNGSAYCHLSKHIGSMHTQCTHAHTVQTFWIALVPYNDGNNAKHYDSVSASLSETALKVRNAQIH